LSANGTWHRQRCRRVAARLRPHHTERAVVFDLHSIEDVRTQLADAKQHAMTRLTQIEDVDLAEASTRLAQSETAYRAALSAMATVGRLSLMDYLR
jgi:hypothetical protein